MKIGDDIEVMVAEVRGEKVRLAFSAPRNVPIYRKEIYEAIQQEKAEQPCDTKFTPTDGTVVKAGSI